MSWQDIVLFIGSFIFTIALIPSVVSKDKPALATSIMTGLVLLIFAYTQFTLNLWLASTTTFANGVIWLYLGYQKHILVNKKKDSRNTMQASN